MNYISKLCLCITTIISCSSFAMESQIIRDGNGFKVFDGMQSKAVRPCFVDPLLKRMNPEQLEKFVEQGNRIRAIKLSDGEHRLQAMVPGKGGFLLTGVIVHQSCRVLGYAGLIVGSGSAIVAGFASSGPVGGFAAISGVIAASTPAVAAIEAGALTVGTAASFIPFLP